MKCAFPAGMVDTYRKYFPCTDTIQGYKGMKIRENVMDALAYHVRWRMM